jgi:hypothetical protein
MNPLQSLSLYFMETLGVSAPAGFGLGLVTAFLCLIIAASASLAPFYLYELYNKEKL